INGEFVGYEEIYAESKGKDYGRPFIGGYAATKESASDSLYFAQAALVGELDAEIEEFEPVGPTLSKDFVLMLFGAVFLIAIIGSAVAAAQVKSGKIFLVGAGVSLSEVLIVIGAIAGLNFVVKPLALATLVSLPIITAVYQNYLVIRIKKESFILKKIAELNSKINKVMMVGLVVVAILIFAIPAVGSPLMVYLLVVLVLSKGGFIGAIKEKR
ncbi:hypothetical protein KY360_06240, partial [Candidatus Woesearchaeota archaeon]|nr:hypothetical protein [Candidatus Woesearchaeota archaeon]